MNSPSGRMSSPGASDRIVEIRRVPGGTLTCFGTHAVRSTVTGNPAIIGAPAVGGLSSTPILNEAVTATAPHAVGGVTSALVHAPGAMVAPGVAANVKFEPAGSGE